ncbi:MAG: biotin transporter BioY [Candidatus Marinimicrobia bacterium]|nr:biotin transporter BioY [Candidatus Neomarinimicrobiota bacterium]
MNLKTQTFKLSAESLIKEATYVMSAVLMMAALSRITIPLQPIPITGQTLGVLLTGIMLGRKRAVAAMITYLTMGLIGFPVFANGAFGLITLIGPTGGYLLGFVPAAFIMGWLGDKGWYNHALSAISAILIGHAIVFSFGLIWLSNFTEWNAVLATGLIPFLPGAVVKTLIAFALIPVMKRNN